MINRISICIPTFNRADKLKYLLDNIHKIGGSDSPVCCISDNSSDSTAESVIDASPIKTIYSRNEVNIGFDRNLLRAVSLAETEYVWLMGDDDGLEANALQMVNSVILQHNPGIIFLGTRVVCDENLTPRGVQHFLKSQSRVFHLGEISDFKEYFSLTNNLGSLLTFVSSIIVKKDLWQEYSGCFNNYSGSAYIHLAILWSILINKNVKFIYLNHPLVKARLGNDSFLEHGMVNRLALDARAFKRIYNDILSCLCSDAWLPEKIGQISLGLAFKNYPAKTDIPLLNRYISYYSGDDSGLPGKGSIRPKAKRDYATLASYLDGSFFWSGRVLHIGYRGSNEHENPIIAGAYALDLGAAAYDGIHIIYESDFFHSIYVSLPSGVLNNSLAFMLPELHRTLKNNGNLLVGYKFDSDEGFVAFLATIRHVESFFLFKALIPTLDSSRKYEGVLHLQRR